MQRKNILRKTFVTSDKWKGAARRVKIRTQVRWPLSIVLPEKIYRFDLNKIFIWLKIIGHENRKFRPQRTYLSTYPPFIRFPIISSSASFFPFCTKACLSQQVLIDDWITSFSVIVSSIDGLWVGGCWLKLWYRSLLTLSVDFVFVRACFLLLKKLKRLTAAWALTTTKSSKLLLISLWHFGTFIILYTYSRDMFVMFVLIWRAKLSLTNVRLYV